MFAQLRRGLLSSSLFLLLACWTGCGSGSSITGQGPGLGNGSNNALLRGQYAFSLSGQSANGPFFAIGSFTADGQGRIGGQEDVNSGTVTTRGTAVHFAGTYAIGTDGRGNAVIGLQPGCPNWQITMMSHAHALITCMNSNITGSGTIDLQDAKAFTNSAFKGNYVFSFSGAGSSGASTAMAGNWSMDGAGSITTGETDVNDLAATPFFGPLSGSYSVAATGRGTATISSGYQTQNFVFYVVNATDFKVIEIDSAPMVSGEVLGQAPGPFTLASLKGTYAFTLGGVDLNGNPLALGGLLPANGNGNISAAILDVNYAGTGTLGSPAGGSYTISTTGRGSGTITSIGVSFPIAFYVAANGTVELVTTGGALNGVSFVVGGSAKAQAGGPFSNGSVAGNYAVNFTGTNLGSGGEEDISGQLSPDGAGALTGILDINNSGSIFASDALSSGTYSMPASGRGTFSFTTGTGTFSMQTYQIDRSTLLFLDMDTNRVVVGIGQKQQF
jgi:hypothetical protein